jgi:hypothetical protein
VSDNARAEREPLSQGAWFDLVRRARIPRDLKAAALVVGSYANADGSRVLCGVSRLAVDLDCSLSTAQRLWRRLRELGLIEMVRQVRKRGMSDEYRLIHDPALLTAIEVPDPDRYREMVTDLREQDRAKSRRRYQGRKAELSHVTHERGVKTTAEAAASHVSQGEVRNQFHTSNSSVSPLNRDVVTSGNVTTTSHVHTSPQVLPPMNTADLRTELAVTRVREPVENPDSIRRDDHQANAEPATPAGSHRRAAMLAETRQRIAAGRKKAHVPKHPRAGRAFEELRAATTTGTRSPPTGDSPPEPAAHREDDPCQPPTSGHPSAPAPQPTSHSDVTLPAPNAATSRPAPRP